MPGVRLKHPTLKSCTFTVIHTRRYVVPLLCPVCGHPHERKTYHLNLDSEGAVIVSQTVFERLKEIGLAGMQLANEVLVPPPLTVGGALPGRLPEIVRYEDLRRN